MLLMLKLEMYQPLHNEQQSQQSTVTVMQNGAAQPVAYAVPPASAVCELYASGQSKVVGIIFIIAGALSIVFNIIGLVFTDEVATIFSQGLWCGPMVSL